MHAWAALVSGSSTTNSSPPKRATTSTSAQPAAQPLRHGDQHAIAGLMPEAIVDLLESVEIHQGQAQLRGCRRIRTNSSRMRSDRWRRLYRPVSGSVMASFSTSRRA